MHSKASGRNNKCHLGHQSTTNGKCECQIHVAWKCGLKPYWPCDERPMWCKVAIHAETWDVIFQVEIIWSLLHRKLELTFVWLIYEFSQLTHKLTTVYKKYVCVTWEEKLTKHRSDNCFVTSNKCSVEGNVFRFNMHDLAECVHCWVTPMMACLWQCHKNVWQFKSRSVCGSSVPSASSWSDRLLCLVPLACNLQHAIATRNEIPLFLTNITMVMAVFQLPYIASFFIWHWVNRSWWGPRL